MIIAVHLSQSSGSNPSYLFDCFKILVKKYPENQFVFFSEKKSSLHIKASNSIDIEIFPSIRNNLLLHFWYNYKLPILLKKYKADVFINEASVASLRTSVKQIMLLKNFVNMEQCLAGEKASIYGKRFFSSCVHKASWVCSTSPFITESFLHKYPSAGKKTSLAFHGLSPVYNAASVQEKENIRQHVSKGYAYFLFVVNEQAAENILPVLQAFSQFKKWQKSSMKLMILYKDQMPAEPVKNFNNYKYREDIILKQAVDPSEAAMLLSAAYAVIYLPKKYSADHTGLYALQSGIPLIAPDNSFCKKIFEDGALYAKPSAEGIGKQMMLVYKDEHLARMIIDKGMAVTKNYTWENMSQLLLKAITAE